MPWLRHVLRYGALALLLALAGGSGSARPAGLPSILLVTLDTTRQDHCSAYGYHRETTPFLEELAVSGVRFETAYAASASTAPSHASLFTSLRPAQHRVLRNGVPLSEARVTLAERFRSMGYQTAGFVSSFVLERRFGWGQGFDVYDDRFPAETSSIRHQVFTNSPVDGGFDRPASATTQHALAWVREARSRRQPLFLFVHYFDPHRPYDPPEDLRDRFTGQAPGGLAEQIARYDAEILAVDRSLRRLVDGLRNHLGGEPLLVVVIGDHGEGLMDHGHMEHGVHLYEEQVRVPLVMQWPGRIPGGRSLPQPVEMVDVLPSILELGGLPLEDGFSGRSLAPALLGRGAVSPRPVFLFRRHYDRGRLGPFRVEGVQVGVRQGPWKYIQAPEEETAELFNLDDDPEEHANVVGARPEVAARLRGLVAASRTAPEGRPDARASLSDGDDARLRALGYVQ